MTDCSRRTNRIAEVPKEKRILVTAHDAFGYFGARYGFRVVGLQGVSTAAKAGLLISGGREQLEEAGEDEDAIDELRDAIESRADASLDEAVEAIARAEIAAAAHALVVHRYLRRFLEEVDAADDD